jgi:hypothetical protein
MALPVPRAALGTIGMPGVPAGPPAVAAGSPASSAMILALGKIDPAWLDEDGAAEVQLCGTESMPTEAARPAPAATCTLPMLGAAKKPVPELKPLPTANPSEWKFGPRTPAAGVKDCMNEPDEPMEKSPEVDIGAAEPVPARPRADENAPEEAVHDDRDDEDDIDEVAVASPGSTFPVAVVSGADNMELSWLGIIDVNWVDIIELSWLDIIELSWPESIELNWPDIKEPSWPDSIDPKLPGNNEVSGLVTTELSEVVIAWLTV